jgi:ketosteroid isomerase-like protein
MLRTVASCTLVASALIAGGCGGSDESNSQEDKKAIEELVARINDATQTKDASAFCLIMQPSAVEEKFHDIDQCVKETKVILKAARNQPVLEVEDVEVDGDVARVRFAGGAGSEYTFVREEGQWYVPLEADPVESES